MSHNCSYYLISIFVVCFGDVNSKQFLLFIQRIYNYILVSNCTLAVSDCTVGISCWLRGTLVERRSLAGELFLFCARPAANG